ncbi:MAG TPA: pilus assembly protein PilM [Methylomirabilota bacterium]|nr:pilus assembly protein PilM [Methylomirabilota bacterium]
MRRRRAVGLDVGPGAIRALTVEARGSDVVVVGYGTAPLDADAQPPQITQAIHAALAEAGSDGEAVTAAVGGPEVVIRQVSLPPLAPSKVLAALEMQYRELGLLPPEEAVFDAQVLRRSKDGVSNEVLSVSAPRTLFEERLTLLRQAAVNVQALDIEPLAILNGALHLTGLDPGELLAVVNIGRQTSVLCVYSEQGPVVARYLEVGADAFVEQLRVAFQISPYSTEPFARSLSAAEAPRAEVACRDLIERMAEDIRLSLTFYRTEYDRESLPRYALGGWVDIPLIGRWLSDRLGLNAPFELMDPLKGVEVKAPATEEETHAGTQYLQAFGLALRGL